MKAVLLIDGNYLYKAAFEVFKKKPKYPDCAFNIFNHYKTKNSLEHLHILRVRYHDSGPCDDQGKFAEKKRKFLDSLKNQPRVDVILGRCRKLKDIYSQKGVDVNIAIDIVRYSLYVDTIIVVSGDSDLIPAIQLSKDRGSEVIVYISPHHKISPGSSVHKLINTADHHYKITEEMLTLNVGKFYKSLLNSH